MHTTPCMISVPLALSVMPSGSVLPQPKTLPRRVAAAVCSPNSWLETLLTAHRRGARDSSTASGDCARKGGVAPFSFGSATAGRVALAQHHSPQHAEELWPGTRPQLRATALRKEATRLLLSMPATVGQDPLATTLRRSLQKSYCPLIAPLPAYSAEPRTPRSCLQAVWLEAGAASSRAASSLSLCESEPCPS